jgi:hypothetical protein
MGTHVCILCVCVCTHECACMPMFLLCFPERLLLTACSPHPALRSPVYRCVPCFVPFRQHVSPPWCACCSSLISHLSSRPFPRLSSSPHALTHNHAKLWIRKLQSLRDHLDSGLLPEPFSARGGRVEPVHGGHSPAGETGLRWDQRSCGGHGE